MMTKVVARLMGCRVLEKDDKQILLKLPMWLSQANRSKVVFNLVDDYAVKNPGKRLVPHIGHRLVRLRIEDCP